MAKMLKPIDPEQWSERHARHLLNRAGFGLPPERVAQLAKMSPASAVDFFVDFTEQPSDASAPGFLVTPEAYHAMRASLRGADEDARRKINQDFQRDERQAVQNLKAWWLERMHKAERPLEEKLTLFWHGHFATSAQKVRSSWNTYQLNETFRQHAAGNFKALTIAVGQSPSMLHYLDNRQSTKKSPNENWARELMELFTLGQGQYSEDDIKNSARSFTGWTCDFESFRYREEVHDFGEKKFMGRTGDFDGWNIIDIIFEQPAAATFITTKLWRYFAYEDPEPEVIEGLAKTLREHDYELRPMLRQMFLSRAFYSEKAMGSQIKSPAQFVVQLASDLEYDEPPYNAMAGATARLGQNLFYPPNVKGWDGNRAWINANALLIRYNLPAMIVRQRSQPGRDAYMGQAALESAPKMEPAMRGAMMQAGSESGGRSESWNPRRFFETLQFDTAGECVDEMARHFLCVPLSKQQRDVLIDSLEVRGGEDGTMRGPNVKPRNLMAALHLLLSTAEYQLC